MKNSRMDKIDWNRWHQRVDIRPREYVCGFCGYKVASNTGYYYNAPDGIHSYINICTNCGFPTFFDRESNQYPGAMIGRDIKNLPDDIGSIYFEMRNDIKNNSYTSALLLARKLIMHLAVDVAGAEEGKSFVQYIADLKKGGYIPPKSEKILEYVKDLGNEKNHEIKIANQEEAEKVIKFVEMLLFFMYEVPGEFPEVQVEGGG